MKILHVISSPRGAASQSIQLGNAIIDKLKAANPGAAIKETNLVTQQFPHLEEAHITSFFTPAENLTDANKEAIRHSNDAIRDIMESDVLVIGAPMYNFSIHSALKAWLDHIVRVGVTFRYSANGPEGLIQNKKAYIAVASGGVYSEGPRKGMDFIEPYLKMLLGFLGITDITFIWAEGLSMPGVQETAMEKAVSSIVV